MPDPNVEEQKSVKSQKEQEHSPAQARALGANLHVARDHTTCTNAEN